MTHRTTGTAVLKAPAKTLALIGASQALLLALIIAQAQAVQIIPVQKTKFGIVLMKQNAKALKGNGAVLGAARLIAQQAAQHATAQTLGTVLHNQTAQARVEFGANPHQQQQEPQHQDTATKQDLCAQAMPAVHQTCHTVILKRYVRARGAAGARAVQDTGAAGAVILAAQHAMLKAPGIVTLKRIVKMRGTGGA